MDTTVFGITVSHNNNVTHSFVKGSVKIKSKYFDFFKRSKIITGCIFASSRLSVKCDHPKLRASENQRANSF